VTRVTMHIDMGHYMQMKVNDVEHNATTKNNCMRVRMTTPRNTKDNMSTITNINV